MHFELTQRLAAPAADVATAYTDPAFYEALAGLPKLGAPRVLDRTVTTGHVQLRVRYRFVGDLSAAVRAVVDPGKLTWVEVSDHDLATRSAEFHLEPDNYADRLSCRGHCRFEPDPTDTGATVRTSRGELKVRAPLVAAAVERAIVSGLEEHLVAEVPLLEQWLAQRSGPPERPKPPKRPKR